MPDRLEIWTPELDRWTLGTGSDADRLLRWARSCPATRIAPVRVEAMWLVAPYLRIEMPDGSALLRKRPAAGASIDACLPERIVQHAYWGHVASLPEGDGKLQWLNPDRVMQYRPLIKTSLIMWAIHADRIDAALEAVRDAGAVLPTGTPWGWPAEEMPCP